MRVGALPDEMTPEGERRFNAPLAGHRHPNPVPAGDPHRGAVPAHTDRSSASLPRPFWPSRLSYEETLFHDTYTVSAITYQRGKRLCAVPLCSVLHRAHTEALSSDSAGRKLRREHASRPMGRVSKYARQGRGALGPLALVGALGGTPALRHTPPQNRGASPHPPTMHTQQDATPYASPLSLRPTPARE